MSVETKNNITFSLNVLKVIEKFRNFILRYSLFDIFFSLILNKKIPSNINVDTVPTLEGILKINYFLFLLR